MTRRLSPLGTLLALAFFVLAAAATPAAAADLPPLTDFNAAKDGDFVVISVPLTQQFVDPNYPNIKSGPGQIQDGVVVYTGSSGTGVTTNFAGMDDAFAAPGGKCSGAPSPADADCNAIAMSTDVPILGAPNLPEPGQNGVVLGDIPNSWDSTMAAFLGFLDGATPLFFFNQNQANSGPPDSNFCDTLGGGFNGDGVQSGQDICVYARVILSSSTGAVADKVFELEGPTQLFSSPALTTNGEFNGAAGTPSEPAEVLIAKGDVCLASDGTEVVCDGNQDFGPFNHNLGANDAAYMAFSPGLNDALAACVGGCAYDTVRIQFLFTDLSNGFEQLFLLTTEQFFNQVPDPASLLLLGAGLIGLGANAWRRRRTV